MIAAAFDGISHAYYPEGGDSMILKPCLQFRLHFGKLVRGRRKLKAVF